MPLLDEATRLDMLLKQFSATDYIPPTSYKIAAVTVVPDEEDGTGLGEPEDVAYDRITVSNNTSEFGLSDAETEVVNLNVWSFPQATQDWGTIFGLGLYNNSDEFMGYLPFSTSKFVSAENILKISAGSFLVTSDTTPLSVSIEEALVPITLTAPNGNRYFLSVDDSGVAVLTATDSFGVPSAPTSLSETGGILSWTAAANDGGTPVISQTIWVSDSDDLLVEFDVIDSAATTYDTDGTLGVFYVTADNVVGPSAPSNTVTIS